MTAVDLYVLETSLLAMRRRCDWLEAYLKRADADKRALETLRDVEGILDSLVDLVERVKLETS